MNGIERSENNLDVETPIDAPQAELSDEDLECVVGGLARPWTETDSSDVPVAPITSVL